MRVHDWLRVLPPETVFVGSTAARMHGLDVGRADVEIAVPPTRGTRSRRGLLVRHLVLPAGDVIELREARVTSLHRTLLDICVLEPQVEALGALDMAIWSRRTTKPALCAYVQGAAGRPGAKRLRQNRLIGARYRILRFTAADIHARPEVVVAQVRGSLA